MTKIKIKTEEALVHIYINGREIHDVTSAGVLLRLNSIPELRMSIAMDGTLEFLDGKVVYKEFPCAPPPFSQEFKHAK